MFCTGLCLTGMFLNRTYSLTFALRINGLNLNNNNIMIIVIICEKQCNIFLSHLIWIIENVF